MNVASNWKLTLSPGTGSEVVILNYGWELLSEPTWNLRRGLEVIPIEGGVPLLRPTLADVYNLSVSIVRTSESDANARRDMMNQFVDRYADLGTVPLRLDIADMTDRYYLFSSVFVDAPRVQRLGNDQPDSGWLLEIPFTAVGLSKVPL